MGDAETFIKIHDHGILLAKKKNRVQCNYCAKEMSGFHRLKCHLGNIGKDVTPCGEVPINVKEAMRNELAVRKRDNLGKEVGDLHFPDLPLRRNWCHEENSLKQLKCEAGQSASTASEKHVSMEYASEGGFTETILPFSRKTCSLTNTNGGEKELMKKCIAKFFYENGIDFNAANTPSFRGMMIAARSFGSAKQVIPTCQELKGWILRDEVREMQEYVQSVRCSWVRTGCTILLEEWIDKKGCDLVSFFVDCPEGPVYLNSFDVSNIAQDVGALMLLIDGIVRDVGVHNAVQIVANTTKGWVGEVGKQYIKNRHRVFWSVSASHCLELMLEKIGLMESVKDVLDKAKKISKFIHARATVLELFKFHSRGNDLFKPSRIMSATAYITLENIILEKKNLVKMFASSEWSNSIWADRPEGKTIASLVADHCFWTEAAMVFNATLPLLRLFCQITGDVKPKVGFIYETMDQTKETIKRNLKNKETQYLPFWEVIDEIWDANLHSPLHAAGYYLNPTFFYARDFSNDWEVSFGLLCCIVHMVNEHHNQDLISLQLDMYRCAKGHFEEGKVNKQKMQSPGQWWTVYGKQCPDLQSFAVKILSQTCDSSTRYGLQRSMVEKLLMKRGNSAEQQLQTDLTFVQYNLRLKHFKSILKYDISADEIDPMDDWVVDESLVNMSEISHTGETANAESGSSL